MLDYNGLKAPFQCKQQPYLSSDQIRPINNFKKSIWLIFMKIQNPDDHDLPFDAERGSEFIFSISLQKN